MSARRHTLGFMVCLLAVAGCTPPSTSRAPTEADSSVAKAPEPRVPPPVTIREVRSDKTAFDPEKKERLTVHFLIDKPAEVTLSIFDGRDRLVYRTESKAFAAGDHLLSWDGRSLDGSPVPPEAYVYTLTARTEAGEVTHDLTDVTGGELLPVPETVWEPETERVRYRLDRPARVNIRFGLQGGPYMRTLIDWVPRAAGMQYQRWDGWDASKAVSLSNHPLLVTSLKAYSLSDNTVLVGPPPDQTAFAQVPAQGARTKQPASGPKRMYFHPDQPLDTRGDVSTSLTLDGITQQDEQGRWVVSGTVPVRLDVADSDRQRVIERRFEPVFYVDGTFAFETETGYLPMTWQWDTSSVNPGEHFITANVRGYEGNFGAATLKVWVVKPTPVTASAAPAATETR